VEKEFIELINKHQGILHKICSIYFYKNEYKEDYFQEMLIRVWKAYPDFKKQCAFSTWLYKVALNTAIDLIRKQSIRPLHVKLSKTEFTIPEDAHNDESDQKDRLYAAINCLSELEKAIIFLYLEEYEYKEIADIIGISESNTGVKINRIKNHLIKILNNGQK
jgi:RNA polymerase sigma-70 factor, ECF subfamily